jgi:hypothetical protein
LTVALLLLLLVPVALGLVLAKRARRAAVASPQERDAMYRTAFGFAPAAGGGEIGAAQPSRTRRPVILFASTAPFAASGIFAAVSPHHAQQLWVFSCRLFGH